MRIRVLVSLAIFFAPLMFFSVQSISAFKILAVLLFLALILETVYWKRYSLGKRGSFFPIIVGFVVYNLVVQISFGLWGAIQYMDYESVDSSRPLNRLGAQLFSFILICILTIYIYRYGQQNPHVVTRPAIAGLKLLLLVSVYELA